MSDNLVAVVQISGTANEIIVTGNPIYPQIGIDPNFTSSITHVGIITAGTWQATPVGVQWGGTGGTSFPLGSILTGNGSSTLGNVSLSSGQILIGTGGAPVGGFLNSPSGTVAINNSSGNITLDVVAPLPIPYGGTGSTALTSDGVLVSNSTGTAVNSIVLNTDISGNPQVLVGHTGFQPTTASIVGDNLTFMSVNFSAGEFIITNAQPASIFVITSPAQVPDPLEPFPISPINVTQIPGIPAAVLTFNPYALGDLSFTTKIGTLTTGTWNASIITGLYGGTGVNNGTRTITIGGNFAMSGAFTFNGTLTANTSVTFPTSGTLLSATSPFTAQGVFYASFPATIAQTSALSAAKDIIGWNTATGHVDKVILAAGTNMSIDTTTTPGTLIFNATGGGGGVTTITGTDGIIASSPSGNVTLSLGVIGSAFGGTGVNNSPFLIQLGGSITTFGDVTIGGIFNSYPTNLTIGSGSHTYPVTIDTSAATTVTLPTTGTLLSSTYAGVAHGIVIYEPGANPNAVPIPLLPKELLVGSVIVNGDPVGAFIPGKNRLLNGDMQVGQRGAGGAASIQVTSPATGTSSVYTIDRWQVSTNGNNCTVSQQVDFVGKFFARVQRNPGQTSLAPIYFSQTPSIASCTDLSNNNVTLSFVAASGSNFSSAGSALTCVILYSAYSNSSSISVYNPVSPWFTLSTTTVTLTSTPQNFYAYAGVPSGATQVAVQFYYTPTGTAGASDFYQITDVQLEASPNPTLYERRTFYSQYQDCLFYYQKSTPYTVAPAQGLAIGNGEVYGQLVSNSPLIYVNFTRPLQYAPTSAGRLVLLTPVSATANQMYDFTTASVCTATSALNITEKNFHVISTSPTGHAAGDFLGIGYVADTEIY